MPEDKEFKDYVLDQLSTLGEFESKAMFGGTALLVDGAAFAKVKRGALWLKADDENRADFLDMGMPQYTYGKDNTRKLNFFQAPPDVLEDEGVLSDWVTKSMNAALRGKT